MKDAGVQRRDAGWYATQAAHAAEAVAQCDRTPTLQEVERAFDTLFGKLEPAQQELL
jgi:hypothetical protein